MAKNLTPEEQIAEIEAILARLCAAQPFRGQKEVIQDVEAFLAQMRAAHARGELSSPPEEPIPFWQRVAVGLVALGGIVRALIWAFEL